MISSSRLTLRKNLKKFSKKLYQKLKYTHKLIKNNPENKQYKTEFEENKQYLKNSLKALNVISNSKF